MFDDVVTLFMKYEDKKNGICQWHRVVLEGVELQKNRAISVSNDGNTPNNIVNLHVPHHKGFIGDYEYLKPKAWYKAEDKSGKITFVEGDFFVEGEIIDMDIYDDTQYTGGLFSYMRKNYDDVYVISSVDTFKVIPHFEVGGR